jgi:signal peptidase I
VIAILIIVFFLNPFHIFAYYSRFYLAECIKIRQDKPFFNLIKGDEVVANKFIYRISTPRRYDIGLFKNNKSLFMARIIGLPGDIIEISSGRFLVNGSEVEGLSSPKENQEFSYKQEVGPSEYFVFKDGDPAYFWKGRCLLVPASFLKGKIYKIYYPLARAKVIH